MKAVRKVWANQSIEKMSVRALTLFCALIYLSGIAAVYRRYPDNHGAGYSGSVTAFVLVAVSAVFFIRSYPRLSAGLIFVSVAGIALLYYANVNNIFIGYDEWIERGMPKWGEPTDPQKTLPPGRFWSGAD